jgi:hypothetical protein
MGSRFDPDPGSAVLLYRSCNAVRSDTVCVPTENLESDDKNQKSKSKIKCFKLFPASDIPGTVRYACVNYFSPFI